jgi:hypothetical protein
MFINLLYLEEDLKSHTKHSVIIHTEPSVIISFISLV